jgi:hypothetical protein
MKLVYIGVALILPTLASANARAAVQSGGAAVATYEVVSDDGCVVTSGEVAVLDTREPGDNPAGVYVTATQQNTCDPNDNGRGYAGYLETGEFGALGVVFGYARVTVIANEYSGSGAAPLTFELDLRWRGRGRITREREVTSDGFLFRATRKATTAGLFTVDGVAAKVTSASLVSETHRSR